MIVYIWKQDPLTKKEDYKIQAGENTPAIFCLENNHTKNRRNNNQTNGRQFLFCKMYV